MVLRRAIEDDARLKGIIIWVFSKMLDLFSGMCQMKVAEGGPQQPKVFFLKIALLANAEAEGIICKKK